MRLVFLVYGPLLEADSVERKLWQ